MPQIIWEQPAQNLKKVTLTFPPHNQQFDLVQEEIINQLAGSAGKSVRIHWDANLYEADFTNLQSVPQKIGIPLRKTAGSGSFPTGDVCTIEQNGQWLSIDGWQPQQQYIRLKRLNSTPPPPIAENKICKNVVDGQACNSLNRLDAVVCRKCGSGAHFETVYRPN
ncbi:hypothetical protein [Larkinella rosea]|uniref:Uncharacterized protein n=1 Tax=Larkinella rosea TaxID=2025312 RepID=A0A3P1BHH6_9BACT|nr:hypothetical protein [Larkinella rosea]RRB00114.1 hypothetical protein EHT25_26180 [Larkinella rosea]